MTCNLPKPQKENYHKIRDHYLNVLQLSHIFLSCAHHVSISSFFTLEAGAAKGVSIPPRWVPNPHLLVMPSPGRTTPPPDRSKAAGHLSGHHIDVRECAALMGQVNSCEVIVTVIPYTLPKTNIAPARKPSQKETSLPTIHFQVLC